MVLPFLDQAPVLSVHEGVVTSFANLEINNQFIDTQLVKRNERCKFYLVRPLNILIPMDLFPSKFLDYGLCQIDVTEVDYSHVADLIVYGNENQVLYPGVGGFIEEIVEDNSLINLASNGEAINSCTFDGRNLSFKRIMVHEMLEASLSKLKANKASKPIMVNSDTALMVRIESYLLGGYLTNRVPLLMGQSAVAKSATVKALCAKHGFRLVDLRTGFMSRLDIQGLTEIEYQEDGTAVSYNCGMEEFIECTDEYIKYCRDAIPKIKEAIDSCVEPDKKKGLQAILKKYQEGAKIPVLFLDEINRCEASVRQAFTNILSSKTFMGQKMSMARLIGACNYPVGVNEEMSDVFLTNDSEDPAFNDRFEAIAIYPQDVLPSWLNWASSIKDGKQNIHPDILEFLENNNDKYYYYNDVENQYLQDYDQDNLSTTPYPNYRTWELLSNYLYKCIDDKCLLDSTIEGFIGIRTADDLKEHLKQKGWTLNSPSDANDGGDGWDDIVRDAIDKQAPTLLVSPSGIGKSSRINRIAKELNAIMIEVNLSEMDRTDLMGPPCKVSTVQHIGGQVYNLDEELSKELEELAGKFTLPAKMTIKAPKKDVVQKFQEALATGRKVVLFFEEMNRVTNPIVMSAVFEAISDHRIFGIDFDPKQVSILGACNMGENFQDVQSLDSAFAARFNIHRKYAYTKEDARSARQFFEKNYSPYLVGYINSLDDDEFLALLKEVEERSMAKSVASTRAWADLDLFLRDEQHNTVASGTILANGKANSKTFERAIKATISEDMNEYPERVIKCIEMVDKKIKNWCVVDSSITVPVDGEQLTGKDLVELFEECKLAINNKDLSMLEPIQTVLSAILLADKKAQDLRVTSISYIIGDASHSFCQYYNEVSGTALSLLKLEDIKDPTLIKPFIDQEIQANNATIPGDMRNVLKRIIREYYAIFGASLGANHMQEVLFESMKVLPTPDANLILISELTNDSVGDSFISCCENGDKVIAKNILNECGVHVDLNADNDDEDLKQPTKKAGPNTKFLK